MGVGLCLPQLGEHVTPEVVRGFCERAEALGYTSLWVQDHFLWPLEPVRGYGGRAGAPIPLAYQSVLAPTELLTAAAAWTSTALLGTSILVAGNHWPAPLAQRLATIDVLSSGRLLVGLGVGWNAEEHAASGSDIETRGARMDEFLDALLACWDDDPVQHYGEFFDIARPRPPLLSGMWSEAGLERTRRHFDGWNPAGMPVARAAEIASDLNARRPQGCAPLDVWFRAFAQFPHQPTPSGDPLERLVVEANAAREAGFREFIVEHNFWSAIASPQDWLDVPDRFADLLRV
jgi:probable F420-dependent oxidoreductase